MQNVRTFSTPIIIVTAALVAGGCGADKLAEKAIEKQIESETGEDFDIDIDDGNIVVESEEGRIELSTDDDGNISVQGESDEGSFSGNASADDDGNVVIQGESDDGEGSFEISGDGETATFESDDGSMVITSDGSLPDEFPSSVPLPDSLQVESSTVLSEGNELFVSVNGSVSAEHGAATDAYASALEDAGFTQQMVTKSPDSSFFSYQNAEYTVSGWVTANAGADGSTLISVTVVPAEG